MKGPQDPNLICRAMEEAGIRFPTSQRGIDFCTDKCPYDRCIVVEASRGRPSKIKLVQEFHRNGLTPKEIAAKTGISIRSVHYYLKL